MTWKRGMIWLAILAVSLTAVTIWKAHEEKMLYMPHVSLPHCQAPAPPPPPEKVEIRSGTLVGEYLSRLGLDAREGEILLRRVEPVYDLSRIQAGRTLTVYRDEKRRLLRFTYPLEEDHYLEVRRGEGGWMAEKKAYPFEWRECVLTGTIRDSLFQEVERMGESPTLALKLAELFAWDVDFYADVQPGDSFKILIKKKYLEGSSAGYGPILAAEFVNQGKASHAVRFTLPDGKAEYYTPDGQSVRKELLKSPLSIGRVTSRFSMHRLHPTLKIVRPHLGVDYAAPIGTPVHAAGDGTVASTGHRGQAGIAVELRHSARMQTLYLHLSRVADGIRSGARVRQGQVVGYVGATGECTGPHLDYRIRMAGTFVNPLGIQGERAEPLPVKLQETFWKTSVAALRALDAESSLEGYRLAHRFGVPPRTSH